VHRYDDAGWVLLSQGLDGGPHRGSGRQTVIDQNDGPTADIRRRTIAPIEPLAARQLLQLARHNRVDLMFRNPETAHDFIIQNAAGGRYRCDCESVAAS
jgi:hypothetical protein